MIGILIIGCLVAGGVGGWYFTKSGYEAKLKNIANVALQMEGHAVYEIRSYAARIKSLL
jgi:hypothetical protein